MTRDDRIRALLPLVRSIARRVHRMVPGQDLDDLVGDGNLGLIRAVDGFDETRAVPLEAYARPVILGAMLNGIRRLDPVSERVRRTVRRADEARFRIAAEEGRLPAESEMERRIAGYARARGEAHRGTALSLDAPLPLGEHETVEWHADPQRIVEQHAHRATVAAAVADLPARHRRVIALHYFGERALRSLARPLGISTQRVSQLHLAALKRLRSTLATAG